MNNSLAEVHPELVSEWSEKNLTLTPDDITFGSNKKVWWRGACGHEWQATNVQNAYQMIIRSVVRAPLMMICSMMLVVYGCIVALSWFASHFIVSGSITTGNLTSMFSYVMSMLMALMILSMIFVMVSMSAASARRISEVLNEKADLANPEKPYEEVEDGRIDFNHVNFSYRKNSTEDTLHDIDIHINAGETIGIIGGTGCGKSSFVSLISRLYDVTEGSVCVGGKDVRTYDMDALRNQVAVVLQKNVLFSGTILDNLRWGDDNASYEDCVEACKQACADEFIERMPKKYDTWIEQGGTNVSGGQRQRLCIARALLKKPNAYIEEMMEGQKVVKVFCHEQESLEQFKQINNKLRESANNANKIANITMPINENIGNISYVLCALVGGVLALSGFSGLTIGTLVAFLSLNKSFTQPVTQISQQVSSIVMAMAGAGRVFDLCDEVPETDEGDVELVNICYDSNGEIHETEELTEMWAWKKPNAANKDEMYTRLQGDVTFDGVDFGYNPDKIVLHDIKMFAKPGQKLAFVGSTGAGKTTITNLINRFYDIQDGKIRYDGININHIKKDDLRRSLGIVLQDTNLFTGTIMDNIR